MRQVNVMLRPSRQIGAIFHKLRNYVLATVLFWGLGLTPVSAQQSVPMVVTLGTAGGPILRSDRAQPANLLLIGEHRYLIDAGEGTGPQLVAAGVRVSQLDAIFITHLHADHVAGISSLLFSLWTERPAKPLQIIGPPGTAKLVKSSLAMLDMPQRLFREELPVSYPQLASLLRVNETSGTEGGTLGNVIYQDSGVFVRSVENSHFNLFKKPGRRPLSRSLSYRFDAAGKIIVFTGDTGPSAALERFAGGADLLVSEAMDLSGVLEQLRRMNGGVPIEKMENHMRDEHLTASAIAALANAARVKAVLLTHFTGDRRAGAGAITDEVRRVFPGDVMTAADLGRYPVP